jgi:hypothetical protein
MAQCPEWTAQSPPVQLVAFDGSVKATGGPQLVVKEDARVDLLKVIGSHPVKAVAVCGIYRTGKSLLLNLLAETQGGGGRFEVGDTVNACTAGIWVRASRPSGLDGSVTLLLDCEGTGNTDRDREHDSRLFALAVLLSSTLIFNTRGVITDAAVQSLATAASLAQHVFRQYQGIAEGVCLSPSFLWVLRDFTLLLEDTAGQPITAQEYLEQILGTFSKASRRPSDAAAAAVWDDQQQARERILELFPQRDCAALVRPVDSEEELQNLGSLPLTDFRAKFLSQMGALRSKVLSDCQTLRAPSGETAMGDAFLALVDAHVEAMNTGAVPELGSVWQHVSEHECARAVEEGLRAFSCLALEVAASFPATDEDMEEVLQRGRQAAQEKFAAIAIGDKEARADYEAELAASVEESTRRLQKENEDVAVRANEAWLQRRWQEGAEERMRRCRIQNQEGPLPTEAIDDIESALCTLVAELRASYAREAVGPRSTHSGPFERVVLRRSDAAHREVAAWRRSSELASEAQGAARKAAAEDRKRLERESAERAKRVAKEVEASRARTKNAKAQAPKGQAASKTKVENGPAAKPDEERTQPKCCVVM